MIDTLSLSLSLHFPSSSLIFLFIIWAQLMRRRTSLFLSGNSTSSSQFLRCSCSRFLFAGVAEQPLQQQLLLLLAFTAELHCIGVLIHSAVSVCCECVCLCSLSLFSSSQPSSSSFSLPLPPFIIKRIHISLSSLFSNSHQTKLLLQWLQRLVSKNKKIFVALPLFRYRRAAAAAAADALCQLVLAELYFCFFCCCWWYTYFCLSSAVVHTSCGYK